MPNHYSFGKATTSPTTVATSSSSNNNTSHDILNSNEYRNVVDVQKEEGAKEEGAEEDRWDRSGDDSADDCRLNNNNNNNSKDDPVEHKSDDIQPVAYMPKAHPELNVQEYT